MLKRMPQEARKSRVGSLFARLRPRRGEDPIEMPEPTAPMRVVPRLFRGLKTLLRWVSLTVLAVGCIGIFYVAVILGETPGIQGTEQPTQPPAMAALPEGVRSIESSDLSEIEALFSRPLATLPAKQGFVLIGGKVEDQRISGTTTTCRVVSLTYDHPSIGGRVVVSSIAPGDYIRRYAQQVFRLERVTAQIGALSAVAMTVDGRPYYMAAQGDTEYILETDADVQVLEMVCGWVTFVGQEAAWGIPPMEADAAE